MRWLTVFLLCSALVIAQAADRAETEKHAASAEAEVVMVEPSGVVPVTGPVAAGLKAPTIINADGQDSTGSYVDPAHAALLNAAANPPTGPVRTPIILTDKTPAGYPPREVTANVHPVVTQILPVIPETRPDPPQQQVTTLTTTITQQTVTPAGIVLSATPSTLHEQAVAAGVPSPIAVRFASRSTTETSTESEMSAEEHAAVELEAHAEAELQALQEMEQELHQELSMETDSEMEHQSEPTLDNESNEQLKQKIKQVTSLYKDIKKQKILKKRAVKQIKDTLKKLRSLHKSGKTKHTSLKRSHKKMKSLSSKFEDAAKKVNALHSKLSKSEQILSNLKTTAQHGKRKHPNLLNSLKRLGDALHQLHLASNLNSHATYQLRRTIDIPASQRVTWASVRRYLAKHKADLMRRIGTKIEGKQMEANVNAVAQRLGKLTNLINTKFSAGSLLPSETAKRIELDAKAQEIAKKATIKAEVAAKIAADISLKAVPQAEKQKAIKLAEQTRLQAVKAKEVANKQHVAAVKSIVQTESKLVNAKPAVVKTTDSQSQSSKSTSNSKVNKHALLQKSLHEVHNTVKTVQAQTKYDPESNLLLRHVELVLAQLQKKFDLPSIPVPKRQF